MDQQGTTEPASGEGENDRPQAGLEAVQEFQGLWPSLVDVVSTTVYDDDVLGAIRETAAAETGGSMACFVSDPSSKDCPLVFVSKGFEQMTGYDCSLALGQNYCRLLPPNDADLNETVNGEELRKIKKFMKVNGSPGTSIINLLLNETCTGERFWNLLHLTSVEVNDKRYILGVQTVLDVPMPSILRLSYNLAELDERCGSDELAGLILFSTVLGEFLRELRTDVGSRMKAMSSSQIADASRLASGSIISFLKAKCDDFEGDLWVPCYRMQSGQKLDGLDFTWYQIINSVGNLLSSLWEISLSVGECAACALSDPSLEDCPLVYISRQFEYLTGYERKRVIGRNCRILQPKIKAFNERMNGEECKLMRDFCKEPKASGSRMVNLLANESRDRQPFWNLLLMEHIQIKGKPYIFAVQTNIEHETERLAELLVNTPASIAELQRLRKLFRSKERRLGTRADIDSEVFTVQQLVTECIDQWLENYPASMGLPLLQVFCDPKRTPSKETDAVGGDGRLLRSSSLTNRAKVSARKKGPSRHIPMAGLMITSDTVKDLPKALFKGIRHFYFMMVSEKVVVGLPSRDVDVKTARIFILQLSEVLAQIKDHNYNGLSSAISFTLVTTQNTCVCFDELQKVFVLHGYRLFGWLLDVKDISKDDFSKCWKQMAAAHAAGDVLALGLKGGGPNTYLSWQRASKGLNAPLSLWALDLYLGKVMEALAESKLKQLVDNLQNTQFLCHNVFGPQEQLLRDDNIKLAAEAVDVDPSIYILKCAEAQSLGAMLPATYFLQSNSSTQTSDRQFVVDYARAASAQACFGHYVNQNGRDGVVRSKYHTEETIFRARKDRQTLQTAQMIMEQFEVLDTDGDGSVARSEFENVFQKMGMTVPELNSLFGDIDKNGDGRISFSEFSAHVFGEGNRVPSKPNVLAKRATLPATPQAPSRPRTGQLPDSVAKLRRASSARPSTSPPSSVTTTKDISSYVTKKFQQMDSDGNGLVTREEFEQVFRLLGLSATDVAALFSGVDADADGHISLTEFSKYVFGKESSQSPNVDESLAGS